MTTRGGIARRLGGGCGIAAAAAALLAAGCGTAPAVPSPVAPVAATDPRAADPPLPEMVMVTFTDRGYRASDVTTHMARPAMLMLVDEGTRPHSLRVELPVSALLVSAGGAPGAPVGASDAIAVTVTAGVETDVTFTPAQPGRYPLTVDGLAAGAVVVDP